MSYLREQDDYRGPRSGDTLGDDTLASDTLANKEHELTLSSAAIFGIFFGQVVLCGVFFGFGYSMGGHRATGPVEETTAAAPASSANFSGFKPAAGQPVGAHTTVAAAPVVGTLPTAPPEPEARTPAVESVHIAPATAPASSAAPVVRATPTVAARPAPTAPATAAGPWVQVAAISVTHPEDATMLQNALRAKGYNVSQHAGPDNFIHLLLGPFGDRAAAEAMRQRLATDGYTAYIK